ncbi:hypothetical protein KTO58_18245 [Chitinophaga pendula]|uniref:DUF5684 domain-containing protein n=1 Tax=Chitinophaga TaxID=79328 RepID=UPI000BAED4B8|nr:MULTISPECIES: DUF5684 domain-containing protein [Chitinophaga]ASZ11378.1 hypothetical protein CK934_10570 [Chitinophaga sp. MD30]UCJ05618.1 hypothetical protein KTO58_18245 [Chitinophaga pendula]
MEDSSSVFGVLFGGVFLIVILVLLAFYLFCYWKVFEKAGQPGWAAIIPIYNAYILTKIIGKPWWWLILLCIPYLNIVFGIWATNLLSKSFGKDIGFTLGLIFLGFIFLPIMAFDRTIVYQGPVGNPNASFRDQINSIGDDLK